MNYFNSIEATADALDASKEEVTEWLDGNITGSDVRNFKEMMDDIHNDIMADDEAFKEMTVNSMINKRDEKREEIQEAFEDGSISEERFEAELERYGEVTEGEIAEWEYLLDLARETDDPEDWGNFRGAYDKV